MANGEEVQQQQNGAVVQGHELKERKPGEFVLPQSQFHEILDAHGITQEVRETWNQVEEQIITDALELAKQTVNARDDLDQATVQIGQGGQGVGSYRMRVHQNKTVPYYDQESGQSTTKEWPGYCEIKHKKDFPKPIRDQMLPQIQKECKEALGIEN